MQVKQGQGSQNLRLYVAYDDYLNADQLSALLSSLDKLYNSLYTGYITDLSVPLPSETRMRITQCHTGQSIEVLIAEGIRQIWDGAGLHILGPIGIASAMARLIIGFAKPVAETRKVWEEGRKTRKEADAEAERKLAEAEKLRAEAEKLRAEAEQLKRETQKEPEKEHNEEYFDLSKVSINERRHATAAVIECYDIVEDSSNIREMRINDVVVYRKPKTTSNEIYLQ